MIMIFIATLKLAIPLLLALIGGLITARRGFMNLGLEGMMVIGAWAGFSATWYLEQAGSVALAPWLGLLAGAFGGLVMGGVLAFLVVTCHADAIVSGIVLVLCGESVSRYLFSAQFGGFVPRVMESDTLLYAVGGLVLIGGLGLRYVAGTPGRAGDTVALLSGSALAGLSGATMTITIWRVFPGDGVAGRGWIVVALVMLAQRRFIWAVFAVLVIAGADAFQAQMQVVVETPLPYELAFMLPYVLALGVLLLIPRDADAE